MTLILIILLLNTALFITLLVNTAKATKENQDKYLEIKRDNEKRKLEVTTSLDFIRNMTSYIESTLNKQNLQTKKHTDWLKVISDYCQTSNLGIIALQDLLHKNK